MRIVDRPDGSFYVIQLHTARLVWGIVCVLSVLVLLVFALLSLVFRVIAPQAFLYTTAILLALYLVTEMGLAFGGGGIGLLRPQWAFTAVRRLSWNRADASWSLTVGWGRLGYTRRLAGDSVSAITLEAPAGARLTKDISLYILLVLKNGQPVRLFRSTYDQQETRLLASEIARRAGVAFIDIVRISSS